MGVTIHFEGKLKSEASFEAVLAVAKRFCEERAWPVERISERQITLKRVRDEQDWGYCGSTRGIAIQPHKDSEPFRLEFDEDLYVQEFTKTQFAPINIYIALVRLLKELEPHFERLEVFDEGEFFETGDHDGLATHLRCCFEALDEYLVQAEKYYGPVRIDGGRIVDVMSLD